MALNLVCNHHGMLALRSASALRATGVVALAACALLAAAFAVDASAATGRHTVPAAGLSLALPTSWKVVDGSAAAKAAVASLGKENPQLAGVLSQLGNPGSVIKFFAFDPVGARTFATNVNVLVSPIPASVTLAQYLEAARREFQSLPGRIGSATTRVVTLPGGRAARTDVRFGLTVRGRRLVTDVTQWAFLQPRKSVVVSYTTTASGAARYAPTFAASSRSIRFG